MPTHSTARERVEYGLDTVPADRTVSVSLQDILFVHQTLGEFMQFLHQPDHYPDVGALHRFLDSGDNSGAFEVLREAYYRRTRDMIPPDIEAAFDEGVRFEHPLPPDYFVGPDSVT